jgi:hypothetical protein
MNRKKYVTVVLVVTAFVAGTFAVGQQTLPAQSARVSPPRPYPVADHIVYGMLLHHAFVFSQQAEQAERAGKHDSAHAYRTVFKNDAELTDAQSRLLNEIASECEQAVKEQDARAKVIIDARRQHFKETGKVLPPSEELKAMQEERNAIILRHRDKLRAGLGEREWARFSEFVQHRVASTITVTPVAPPKSASTQDSQQ